MEEEKAKQFVVENKRLAKEMAEMKREAQQEERRMNKLKKEHEVSDIILCTCTLCSNLIFAMTL